MTRTERAPEFARRNLLARLEPQGYETGGGGDGYDAPFLRGVAHPVEPTPHEVGVITRVVPRHDPRRPRLLPTERLEKSEKRDAIEEGGPPDLRDPGRMRRSRGTTAPNSPPLNVGGNLECRRDLFGFEAGMAVEKLIGADACAQLAVDMVHRQPSPLENGLASMTSLCSWI
jgi:hypothetical protein